jgi:heptosyltransferase-2
MKNIERVIVLRFRRVGDSVLSSVICSSLRKTFPNATVDYVLNEEIAPLFENHPDIDHIITFNKEEMRHKAAYLKKVRRIMQTGNYDAVIDTRTTVKTLWFSFFSLKTPYRIGKKKFYNLFIHNYRIDTRFDGTDDETGCTLRLLSPLEKIHKIQYIRQFKVYVTREEKEAFSREMAAEGIDLSKPVIVCAVTARLAYKIWAMERMQQLLKRIIDTHPEIQLIFNYGGREEEEAALHLKKELNNSPAIFTNIRAKNLRELAAMLANACFFFGNEGGPRHISQALDVPSFAIYPPNISKKKWLPDACERFQGIEPSDIPVNTGSSPLTYQEQFDLITVDEVWNRLDKMLKQYAI